MNRILPSVHSSVSSLRSSVSGRLAVCLLTFHVLFLCRCVLYCSSSSISISLSLSLSLGVINGAACFCLCPAASAVQHLSQSLSVSLCVSVCLSGDVCVSVRSCGSVQIRNFITHCHECACYVGRLGGPNGIGRSFWWIWEGTGVMLLILL